MGGGGANQEGSDGDADADGERGGHASLVCSVFEVSRWRSE